MTTGIPRPLKFNSMQQFVFGNSGQFGQSYRSRSPKSGLFVIKPSQSLYDRYNVNNLLLSKVNKNHIQAITKNIVLNQEDINVNRLLAQTNMNGTKKNFAHTQKQQNYIQKSNSYQPNMTNLNYLKTGQSPSKTSVLPFTSQGFYNSNQRASKQFSQNQLLFNFNKIAEQKKTKKKEFLQNIQAKLNLIQQDAKQLQQCQFQQQIQLEQIQRIHNDMEKQITGNSFAGRINKKIHQNVQDDDDYNQFQEIKKPQSLNINMSPVQINHVLNSHYEENQRLLDQITRVKSKSKQKSSAQNTSSDWKRSPAKNKEFQKTGKSSQGFNKTSGNQALNSWTTQNNKKLIPAATMKYPPKHKK